MVKYLLDFQTKDLKKTTIMVVIGARISLVDVRYVNVVSYSHFIIHIYGTEVELYPVKVVFNFRTG